MSNLTRIESQDRMLQSYIHENRSGLPDSCKISPQRKGEKARRRVAEYGLLQYLGASLQLIQPAHRVHEKIACVTTHSYYIIELPVSFRTCDYPV